MIRRNRERATGAVDWREVLAPAAIDAPYEQQLDALLAAVMSITGLRAAHLYLADPNGQRLHLERATLGGAVTSTNEGGAEAMSATPPAELLRGADDASPRIVPTPAGRYWGMPLVLADAVIALLLVGPVGEQPPRPAVEALDAVRWPLAYAVAVARDREVVRRRLAAATAELDSARRLQSSALELDRFLDLLLDLAISATSASGGFVAVVDEGGRIAVRVAQGIDADALGRIDFSPERGMFDWSIAEIGGGALILRDIDAAVELGWSSVLAVPVHDDLRPLGIIALVHRDGDGAVFDTDGLELLSTYAEQARLMLGNARLFASFVEEYLATVQGLARSLDVRRPATRGRHDAVAASAAMVATQIGLPLEVVEAIRIAASIHDVGMVALHGNDLAAGDLDHPSVSAGLVEHLPLHPEVVAAIRSHHEWYDGWGFPSGLRGEAIPIGGRIIGVIVFLAELASGDPVRSPATNTEMGDALVARRGSQFDPAVVDAALLLLPGLPLRPPDQEA